VWSLAFAAVHGDARVTGNDLPAIVPAFMARAQELGLAARVSTLPGNMFTIELPPAHFDLIILANVVRLEPPERARQLIRRAAAALRPGGRMLIVDALACGFPLAELRREAYALYLALRTEQGRVHRPADIMEWMAEAGLCELQALDLGAQIGAAGDLLGVRS
jgi:SAM-dependent methyltransferase